jgi:soluble lytic murein transglycosylase
VLLGGLIVAGALVYALASGLFGHAVREIELPLRHEDIIRQQAAEKDLDPSLVAGMIYVESRFSDRTSAAGAKGLMQIMPETAQFIADRSGGTNFSQDDLSTAQVNISYGAWYLRWLLDHYHGDESSAVAAYNAGVGNVDRWAAQAASAGHKLGAADIPFPETRAYVQRVLDSRKRYAKAYPKELGLR